MKELALKYGCNPNQKPSKIYMADGSDLPIQVLSGKPGYINFLDAFNGFRRQLLSSMYLPPALLWDFLLQRLWQRSTG